MLDVCENGELNRYIKKHGAVTETEGTEQDSCTSKSEFGVYTHNCIYIYLVI